MDLSEYAEPLPTELEQIVDEARADLGQGPAKRAPAQGITDMAARIQYHTTLLDQLRRQPTDARVQALIQTSEQQLTLARNRLAEYQLQQQGLN